MGRHKTRKRLENKKTKDWRKKHDTKDQKNLRGQSHKNNEVK